MKRAKKIAAKRPKKTKKKIAVKRKRTVARERRPIDVFELLPKEKRKKRSYQWVTVSVMGTQYDADLDRMLDAGWNPANQKNFPRLRKHWDKKAGGIVVGGQMLMERSEALTDKGKQADIAAAKAIMPTKSEHGYEDAGGYGGYIPDTAPVIGDGNITSLHSAAKARVKELGGGVPVSIKLALTEREIEAAAICNLSVDDYAQRKIQMGLKWGEPAICLIESDDGVYRFAKITAKKE